MNSQLLHPTETLTQKWLQKEPRWVRAWSKNLDDGLRHYKKQLNFQLVCNSGQMETTNLPYLQKIREAETKKHEILRDFTANNGSK